MPAQLTSCHFLWSVLRFRNLPSKAARSGGNGEVPGHAAASRGVVETELGGVQGHPGGAAAVGQRTAVDGPVVDAFTAERGTRLAKVDADLMGAACFQTAFDEPRNRPGLPGPARA